MDNRLLIIFLAVALAMATKSKSYTILHRGPAKQFSSVTHGSEPGTCNGLFGQCLHVEEMAMESGVSRRNLGAAGRYISYDALKKNSVPCNGRGRSYYGCGTSGKANPYNRGCSVITRCARFTD